MDDAQIIGMIGQVFCDLGVRDFSVTRTSHNMLQVAVFQPADVEIVREHALTIHWRTADLGCTMHVSVDKRTPESIYVRSKRYASAVVGPYEAYLTP